MRGWELLCSISLSMEMIHDRGERILVSLGAVVSLRKETWAHRPRLLVDTKVGRHMNTNRCLQLSYCQSHPRSPVITRVLRTVAYVFIDNDRRRMEDEQASNHTKNKENKKEERRRRNAPRKCTPRTNKQSTANRRQVADGWALSSREKAFRFLFF